MPDHTSTVPVATQNEEGFKELYKNYCKAALDFVSKNHDRSGRLTDANGQKISFRNASATTDITKQKIALNSLTQFLETNQAVCVAAAILGNKLYLACNAPNNQTIIQKVASIKKVLTAVSLYHSHTAQFHRNNTVTITDSASNIFQNKNYPNRDYLELLNGVVKKTSFSNANLSNDLNWIIISIFKYGYQSLFFEKEIEYINVSSDDSMIIHAEVKLLQQLLNVSRDSPENILFGISRFCCPKCTALIYSLHSNEHIKLCSVITGSHQNLTEKWHAPEFSLKEIAGPQVENFCTMKNIDDSTARKWISELSDSLNETQCAANGSRRGSVGSIQTIQVPASRCNIM